MRSDTDPSLAKTRTRFGPPTSARFLYGFAGVVGFAIAYVSAQRYATFPGPLWQLIALVAGVLVVCTLIALGANRWSKVFKKKQQARRDARSAAILSAAVRREAPDFSLYLRAFEVTGRMQRSASPAFGMDFRGEDSQTDFETELAEAVENDIPLVGLGTPGEFVGAGRVPSTAETWQSDVAALAAQALVIFVLPSGRNSVLWEIDWILANKLLPKTIFVLPAGRFLAGLMRKSDGEFDWKGTWGQIVAAAAERKIHFPDYHKDGQLFTLRADGSMKAQTSLRGHVEAMAVARVVNDHLKRMAAPAARENE